MEINNYLAVTSREELRAWLHVHGRTQKCCWVTISLKPNPDTLLYLDAVEESLCYGWIDGIKKKISENQLMQRLSPRSKQSSWTELNKERVRRLETLGLMHDEGRQVLPIMDPNAFIIDDVIERRLKDNPMIYANFLAFPALYQRVRIDTIQSVKHQPALFQHRLDKLITHTEANQMYGQWHDHGRLLVYNDEHSTNITKV
ncbi:YdeI/OmpD-associated family protein [Paenibacillus sp. MER 99-2]|uniref:YdeI/OmpD-associated family protein n=1 Tax=Paenibacillus sp. MER 99-2 TaxID=2939572 RepID=UPI00203B2B1B|nr:YdeI/OmpD-associated family protein [Paenibacillus sp. MER 99-2]MCM3174415.1 YdeI/OmpD-associated family protein [Paenibacillus sp. MER 99-2]